MNEYPLPVVVMSVEVAPLPDGRVGPAAREVGLGLALHGEVVRRQLAPLRHVAHDVEQPVAHATREVRHLVLAALRHLATSAVVLDLNVVVLRAAAQLGAVEAEAALLVHFAVGGPGLVVVGAHLAARVGLVGTLLDAVADGVAVLVDLAHATSAAVHLQAWI